MRELLYIGTYTDTGESGGIYLCAFDDDAGELEVLSSFDICANPSYLAVRGNRLYAVSEQPAAAWVYACAIGANGGLDIIDRLEVPGAGACHIAVHPGGRQLYVSNYLSGDWVAVQLGEDGRLGGMEHFACPAPDGSSSHVHSATPDSDGRHLIVANLGTDTLTTYRLDAMSGGVLDAVHPAVLKLRPGDGPRHFVFHPNRRNAYAVNELSSTVSALWWDNVAGGPKLMQTTAMLPDGFVARSDAADIHLSPDGRWLYASNRGHDSIAVYRVDGDTGLLARAGICPCGGREPRGFGISQTGKYLIVANQNTGNVVVHECDAESGVLKWVVAEAIIPRPVCVKRHGVQVPIKSTPCIPGDTD